MANEPIVLTRETLYQHVWSEPIIHVARRVGLSGRGLGKLCARYSIPVPPRGWWAKKHHGHNVRQTPLPPIGDPRLERIVLYPSDSAPLEVEAPELLRESSPEWRIDADEELQILHPLVKRAATAIRTNSRDPSKRPAFPWNRRHQAKLSRPGPGCLDVSVSKALVSRALRIMQALVTAFDKRGYEVSVTPESATIVRVLNEPFQIALTERFQTSDRQGPLQPTNGAGAVRSLGAANRFQRLKYRDRRQTAATDREPPESLRRTVGPARPRREA